jgi:hypothetical protein
MKRFRALLLSMALVHGVFLLSASASAQQGILGIPMSRMGSGTSWLPDSSPMHAVHAMRGAWELMAHGVAYLQYDRQNGTRGSDQFGSVNWGMLMAGRELGGGRLQLRGMLSLEPFTVGARGYPLLLQSGEAYRGMALVDRQHPHDLFMELAAQYEHALGKDLAVSLYLAPVGEPAVGPVAFPHRPSAANDPLAPIGHHWQDATHVAFGTVTAGVFTRMAKLEGSIFNGREPDENRTNLDYAGRSLDSYAGRVSVNPTPHWSLSGSFAYLKSPEGLRPNESIHRTTVSALYSNTVGGDGMLSAAAIYGANRRSGAVESEPSYLVEANLDFMVRHNVFGRVELVRKESVDLALPPSVGADAVNVGEIAVGYAYDLNRAGPLRLGVGVRGSLNFVPQSLEPLYGSRTPTGLAVFLRLRPAYMSAEHDMMKGMPMAAMTERGAR